MLPAAVAGALPRRQAVARASVSALAASLPLLYVSLLRPPPAALAGDTAFWFLMSNCVIAAIVATSADAGALLFRPAGDDDDGDGPCRDDGRLLSCASAGQPPPVAAQAGIIGSDAVVPSFAVAAAAQDQDQPPTVDVDINGGRVVQGEAGSAAASSYSVHHVLPSLMEGGDDEEGAGSEPLRAEMNHPIQQRGKEDEITVVEQSTFKNSTVEAEAQGEEQDVIEVIPLATIEEGSALAEPLEPEPWARVRVTSTRSLPVEEAAAAREGGLRRSATVGSKPAEEESEYWQLSDEELNRRVEDFIARFNREIRRQVEQEASSVTF